jgi:hypothetical protein
VSSPRLPGGGRGLAPRHHPVAQAYDSDTGRWLARHWFAWPGAVLADLALGAADRPAGPPVVPTR